MPSLFPHKKVSTPRKLAKKVARYDRVRKRQLNMPVDQLPKRAKHCHSEVQELVQSVETTEQCSDSELQKSMVVEDNRNLRRERDEAVRKVKLLETSVCQRPMSASSVEGDDRKSKDLIGLNWLTFVTLFNFMSKFVPTSSVKLTKRDQLFVTLVKLRHNPSFLLLAHTVGMSKSTVIAVFWRWIDAMSHHMAFLVHWPDRENIFRTIPPVFKTKFPRLTSIIDCFEIFIDAPKNLHARARCYSNYKKTLHD